MLLIFEISKPCHCYKVEKIGKGEMIRIIWAWFSVTWFRGEFNDIARVIRADERRRMAEVSKHSLIHMLEEDYERDVEEYSRKKQGMDS